MASLSASQDSYFQVVILELGSKIKYTVPSFPVFSACLREIKFQFLDETKIYDGYIKDCPSLDRSYPGLLRLCFGYTNAFSIDPEEFELCIPTTDKALYGDCVFVIWKWTWEDVSASDDIEELDTEEFDTEEVDKGSEDVENLDEDVDETVTHSLTFKCVGANKTMRSQEVLAESAQKLKKNETVEVRLRVEPNNPVDARAIAFDCKHGSDWELIGYVVREALDDVHDAIEKCVIISVQFDWIRFITHWSRSGPGWYCGIKVTKKGQWPAKVVQCSSTLNK